MAAINKKLIHFSKLTDFQTRLNSDEILDTSIVFIQDAKKIWTHGQYYDCGSDDIRTFKTLSVSGTSVVADAVSDTLTITDDDVVVATGDATNDKITLTHAISGVTASSYGQSSTTTLAHGGTFTVPYITVNKYGHITSCSSKTLTLPSAGSDTKVTLTKSTSTSSMPVLLAYSASPTSGTASTSYYSEVTITPSTGSLYAPDILSDGGYIQILESLTITGTSVSATTATITELSAGSISISPSPAFDSTSTKVPTMNCVANYVADAIGAIEISDNASTIDVTYKEESVSVLKHIPWYTGTISSGTVSKSLYAEGEGLYILDLALHYGDKVFLNDTNNIAGTRTSALTLTTGGTTSGRYYGVEMDSSGKMFVNVPWSNTNTLTTAGSSNKTATKLYLVGATSQSSSGVTTYSNSNVYINTSNQLYAGGGISVGAASSFAGTLTFSGTIAANGNILIGYNSGYGAVYAKSSTGTNINILQLSSDTKLSLGYGVSSVTCPSLTQTSDARYKNILGDVTLTTSQIANAPAVYFTWNSGDDTTTRQIGTTAQYWKQYVPEAIVETDGKYTLNYSALALVSSVVLAKDIETYKQRVECLEERVKALEEKNNELLDKLNELADKLSNM